jgi:ferredoxin-NADP reductase
MDIHKVIGVRAVSETAFVLRFTKEGKDFTPGMHITVGLPSGENRPYSIYSKEEDPFLEILVKEIPDGAVSPSLRNLKKNEEINVGQPRGYFCLPSPVEEEKVCLIATGTGIAPYHSFVNSFPNLDYHVLHGVRDLSETYDLDVYNRDRVTICTSRTNEGDYQGRVTGKLEALNLNEYSYFYICGGYEMLDDVYDILENNGISREKIKTEGYF